MTVLPMILTGICITFPPAFAQTGDRDFTLSNQTRFDISRVMVSTMASNKWTTLRNSAVDSGDTSDFSFDDEGQCILQLRVEFANGHYTEWMDGFDFCHLEMLTITYNGTTDRYTATPR